jgi:hypothetical protein
MLYRHEIADLVLYTATGLRTVFSNITNAAGLTQRVSEASGGHRPEVIFSGDSIGQLT